MCDQIINNECKKQKVCVIGAGAAGLCAARHLIGNENFTFDMYEQTNRLGGTWNYTEKTGFDDNGLPIHSSMYKNLRTNLPMEIMAFVDYPWQRKRNSFVSHNEVLNYLLDYAEYYKISKYVKFLHQVIDVKFDNNLWIVKVKNLSNNHFETNIYDAIFICNGRYAKPAYPKLFDFKNNENKNYQFQIIHSHDYREASKYKNKNIFILGAGPSGIDITLELAEYAKNIYLCHHLPENFIDLPENVCQINASIKSITETEIIMSDNRVLKIDVILLATGYGYDFTFLDKSCEINVSPDGRVENVFLHLINIAHPTMAIWAIPQKILPFQIYDQQVQLFIKTLLREVCLPSKEEMMNSTNDDFQRRLNMGIAKRHAHKMMDPFLWEYDDQLANIGKLTPIKPVVRYIFNCLHKLRTINSTGYKDFNLLLDDDNGEKFQFIPLNNNNNNNYGYEYKFK